MEAAAELRGEALNLESVAACSIAKSLIDNGAIDRVFVIAPRVEVVRQWAKDFHNLACVR
jgi:hypothetical protein